MELDNKLFATRLRSLREHEGLTVYQLAKATGISESSITNYESGSQDPTLTIVKKLCLFFKCSLDFLSGIKDKSELSTTSYQCAKLIDAMNRFEQDWTYFLLDAITTKIETMRKDRRYLSEGFLREITGQ